MSSTESIRTHSPEVTPNTREARALRLFEERGHDIRRIGPNLYRVPSCTGKGSYDVLYGGEHEECPCPDYQYNLQGRAACKHLLAVGVMHATRRGGVKVRQIGAAGDPFLAAAQRKREKGCSWCFGGWLTITVEEDGQETYEAVPCRRCS